MFVTGLYNRTNNKHNRQTKLDLTVGLSLGVEIYDQGLEMLLRRVFTSVSPVVGRQPNDDVQDSSSTKRNTREENGEGLLVLRVRGHRQPRLHKMHKSKIRTRRRQVDDNDDDDDDDDFDADDVDV